MRVRGYHHSTLLHCPSTNTFVLFQYLSPIYHPYDIYKHSQFDVSHFNGVTNTQLCFPNTHKRNVKPLPPTPPADNGQTTNHGLNGFAAQRGTMYSNLKSFLSTGSGARPISRFLRTGPRSWHPTGGNVAIQQEIPTNI